MNVNIASFVWKGDSVNEAASAWACRFKKRFFKRKKA